MNNEIKALKSELAMMKLQFSERVRTVEERLEKLSKKDDYPLDSQVDPQVDSQIERFTAIEKPSSIETKINLPRQELKSTVLPVTAGEYLAIRKESERLTPSTPSFITLFIGTLLSALFDWLSPITKIYQSYKERGMLGIFTLTMVGITLTLAGFGYLMQLLIDQMGAGTKSLLMCLLAISVIAIGITLKIKTRFSEFATSIVTLGILLSYSTVYFSGSVYGILPDSVVLLSYLLIAFTCHILALKLETKVVAALGIIGVACMPILSNTNNIEPLYYLWSLVFVTASSLVLALKYLGPWLANLSLVFVIVAIEWIISIHLVDVSAWTVDLFYLMFFSYFSISLLQDKSNHKDLLLFLTALVGSTALLFFQASDLFSGQMTISFIVNSVAAGAVAIYFYKVKRQFTHLFVLVASLWTVLAVVSAISSGYWGIAWAAEGLILLFIARKYSISSVIHQGQILTAIALLYTLSALILYFPLPALRSVEGWLLSVVIVAVIALWQRMIKPTDLFDDLTVNKIKPVLQLLESLWLSILVIACATIWLGNWTGAAVILVQFALLFRAKHCKQVSIEILAGVLIVVPLIYVYQASLLVDSYRFMALPLFGKMALSSAFAQLWLWSAFYRKYHVDSEVKNVAEILRIVFYLLVPIFWLGSAFRRLDENVLMILWLAPAIALFLAEKIKHQLLIKEAKILTIFASFSLIFVIGQLTLVSGIIAFIGFAAFYAVAYFLNKKEVGDDIYRFICSWALISLGFSIPSFIGFQSNNLFIAVLIGSLYWATMFNRLGLSEHLKRNELVITLVNLALILVAWVMTPINAMYAIIPGLFLLAALYHKESRFKQYLVGRLLGSYGDLLLHSIAAISYTVLLYSLTVYRLELLIAPVLAVHGALILFLKDRRLITVKYSFILILLGIIKLALVDAANALLWQKVVLFMGIGIFILAASFWYQKIMNNTVITNEG
ncbi:MAG: DUF2339 domain-containing protein [Colwellia sp.]|nr:DUF2339 domain-containing protein [Colwellia sp.]